MCFAKHRHNNILYTNNSIVIIIIIVIVVIVVVVVVVVEVVIYYNNSNGDIIQFEFLVCYILCVHVACSPWYNHSNSSLYLHK